MVTLTRHVRPHVPVESKAVTPMILKETVAKGIIGHEDPTSVPVPAEDIMQEAREAEISTCVPRM